MDTLGDTIDRRTALPADSLCEAALAAFIHDLDCRALAIVDGERPIGIVHREAFLARMERAGAANRPILETAEPDPLIVEANEPVGPFVERTMGERAAALLDGFIICRDGAYEGVCDLAMLLPALGSATAGPREDAGLIERICAEVREPVAHALAAADGLGRLRLPEGAAQHLETITEAAHTTLSLLDTAAELQRAEAGRLEIAAAPRRLQEMMDDIEARWRVQAEVAGVTLLVSYDGAPDCAAVLDSARLMQVFDALIGHAMAHSNRGVIEASLQVRPIDDGFALTGRVRDNGATYAPHYLAGMFRAVGDATHAGGMGMQLELMLAERAIAAMAGVLKAKPNPGPGATVAFEIEAPAADGAGALDAAIEELAPTRSAHILVVDDNATNRMVVEALCEMFDCSTESVIDGIEAVEAAKAGRYDVILMDIKMPRMDGVTAAREIRKLAAPAGKVPIIALTANADTDEVAQYLAAGMRCVVEKPIKPERLLEALDGALAERIQGQVAA
ncbi:MAG TPA: response regulator [Caulobacteraceae bacterium]|jgi:CheY-like chemotaxis protein|nr:response regulator [Caulobacteraceae bacterium]